MPLHKSYSFFSAAYRILGDETVARIWNKSTREIYRWSADPRHCESTAQNPLDKLITTCESLQELGREDIVEGGLRLLVEPLGYELTRTVTAVPVNPDRSVEQEALDIVAAVGILSQKLLDPAAPHIQEMHQKLAHVMDALHVCAREVDEAIAKVKHEMTVKAEEAEAGASPKLRAVNGARGHQL